MLRYYRATGALLATVGSLVALIASSAPALAAGPAVSADLPLALEGTPDQVGVGGNVTYPAFVRNSGPEQASNVTLSNDLGDKLALVSASASQGSCTGSGPVSCALGTLAKGAYAKVTIIAKATKPGLAIDQARVTANENDPSPGDNQRHESTTIRGPESV
jgi:large repetitive protein